jgi:hypothetical protein
LGERDMKMDLREYNTGTGELMCFVLAWAIAAVAVWSDYAGRNHRAADKVAVIGPAPASEVDFD